MKLEKNEFEITEIVIEWTTAHQHLASAVVIFIGSVQYAILFFVTLYIPLNSILNNCIYVNYNPGIIARPSHV